jgi:hypothetical protein
MDYTPHFTVGNMKRSLDVVAATGDKIVALWADPYVFLCLLNDGDGMWLTR